MKRTASRAARSVKEGRAGDSTLAIQSRQRVRKVNIKLLKEIVSALLQENLALANYELGIHLVAAREMAGINWQYLQHEGSTDVITFDHLFAVQSQTVHGEIFVCIDDAIKQAREFGTTWQSEIVRYVVHGILHLLGHDDLAPAKRREMKREENRLLRQLTRQFNLRKL